MQHHRLQLEDGLCLAIAHIVNELNLPFTNMQTYNVHKSLTR